MHKTIVALAMTLAALASFAVAEPVDLAGRWGFRLDGDDRGVKEKWYTQELGDEIQLPGALQNQGYGNDVTVETEWTGASNKEVWLEELRYAKYRQPGNIKVPFCLQPEKHYIGAAWYQHWIEIPAVWEGKHVILTLERGRWGGC
ncbi:MAG: hypothetical protein ACYTE5_06570 [Planctomycetota bacterium]